MAEARPPVAMVMTTGFEIYQQQLVHGVRQVLAPRGLVLVVNTKNFHGSGLTPSVEHLIRTVSPYGVLMTPCLQADQEKELVSLLEEMEIPTVTIAVRTPGRSYVHGDDLSGMRALMAHLLDECGVRRPAHARGVPHQPDAVIREQVFREELAARGIPVDEDLIFDGEFWHEETYRELRALLNRRRDIDAVVAASDVSALGALKALTDEGLRVPDDVLVTGFDNSPTTLCWPALTTVNPEQPAQGRMAAERLLAEIDGAPPGEEVLVPSRLVVRGSTRRLPPGDPEQVTEVISLAQDAQDQLASRDALWGLAYVLSHCSSPADVADALAEGTLSRLGISRCFLAIFTRVPQFVGTRL
ncbi:MAG: LacI family transcriptional regulator [Actinomycetales bacterium]|nr:LacI family transcriptional regulator [Actinomycetales bacterium]